VFYWRGVLFDKTRVENCYNEPISIKLERNVGENKKMLQSVYYSKGCAGKYLSNAFPIQNVLKQRRFTAIAF
jgi:hypothetical protein